MPCGSLRAEWCLLVQGHDYERYAGFSTSISEVSHLVVSRPSGRSGLQPARDPSAPSPLDVWMPPDFSEGNTDNDSQRSGLHCGYSSRSGSGHGRRLDEDAVDELDASRKAQVELDLGLLFGEVE